MLMPKGEEGLAGLAHLGLFKRASSRQFFRCMDRTIWLDGKLVPEAEAKVSVFDHGLLYGDGVFEGIRFYNGRVFRLEEHTKRLFLSAKAILITLPWTPEEVNEAVCETIRANGLEDGYIRLVITRGVGGLGPQSLPL